MESMRLVTLVGWYVVAIAVFITPVRSYCQSVMLTNATYEDVLDQLYGRMDESVGPFEYRVVLRFMPPDDVESQVIIEKRLEANEYTMIAYSPEVPKSILSQARELWKSHGNDANAIAKEIRIKRSTLNLQNRDIESLLNWLKRSRETAWIDPKLYVSGTIYKLSVVGASERTYFERIGLPPPEDSKNSPLIRWMNRIRAETMIKRP